MPLDYNGTSDNVYYVGALSYPFTFAIWFRPDAAAEMSLVTMSDENTGADYLDLKLDVSINDRVSMVVSDSGGATLTSATSDFSTGTWQHAAATFTNATSRAVYYQGGNKGTSATSRSPTNLSHTGVGVLLINSTQTLHFNGHLAHACIWTTALTDGEVSALASGWHPLGMRSSSIWGYWPLIGIGFPGYSRDYSGNGRTLSTTDVPSAATTVAERQLFSPPRGPVLTG